MLSGLGQRLRRAAARLQGRSTQAQALRAVPRPEGPLICLRIGPGTAPETVAGVALVLARLHRLRPDLRLLLAAPPSLEMALPDGVERIALPEDSAATAKAMLDHLAPCLIVLLGSPLPASLIAVAAKAGVRMMLADVQLSAQASGPKDLARRGQRALLRRLACIVVRDQASQGILVNMGFDPAVIEVGGGLESPAEPLRCSEAERASLAALTRTRPVWLAASVPGSEIAAMLAAQDRAQRHAHRMLLILAPDTPEIAPELAARLAAEGCSVARRSVEGEPGTETEVFIADDPAEYGLWYRIAPVTYMGGTLSGATGQARSPYEAAALGSAIVHGPQTAPFGAEYARLDEARATRAVHDAISLGEAVADLMAPDRAAVLAHNAWAVASSGAAAAAAVVQAIGREFDLAQDGKGI